MGFSRFCNPSKYLAAGNAISLLKGRTVPKQQIPKKHKHSNI
jgi:hypothetical protein